MQSIERKIHNSISFHYIKHVKCEVHIQNTNITVMVTKESNTHKIKSDQLISVININHFSVELYLY